MYAVVSPSINNELQVRIMLEEGEKIPFPDENTVYKTAEILNAKAYFATLDNGFVHYFVCVDGSHASSKTKQVHGRLEDGTAFVARGPWPSHSSVMNRYFEPSLEVTVVDQRGSHYQCVMLLSNLQLLLKDSGYHAYPSEVPGDSCYVEALAKTS